MKNRAEDLLLQVAGCRPGSTLPDRATKVPSGRARGVVLGAGLHPSPSRYDREDASRAPCSSITGPMSMAGFQGPPRESSSMAPNSMVFRPSRRYRLAHREREGPSSAGRRSGKAESRMSRTACSGRAVLSTIIAFRPPVSAMSGCIRRQMFGHGLRLIVLGRCGGACESKGRRCAVMR